MNIKYNYPLLFSMFIILMHLKYFFRDFILLAVSLCVCISGKFVPTVLLSFSF